MQKRLWTLGVTAAAVTMGLASGQALQRRANIVGGGGPDGGQCGAEVVVDGAAEVEIRGMNGIIRNLSGQTPQWRRFDCSSAMPPNPVNLRFSGLDGRGRQELVRGPQNGGATVVRIQDNDGGADTYQFVITWGSGNNSNLPGRGGSPGRGTRYTTAQAIEVCQNAIRQQAADRFRNTSVAFRNTTLDDNPGRQDWITGLVDMRRGYNRDETYRFTCSVNFDTGEVRSAQIEFMDRDWRGNGPGNGKGAPPRLALDACESAVEDRLYSQGYQHVDFLNINVDDRPGRNDWVVGNVRADIRARSNSFTFNCSVNFQNGAIRSVEVRRSR